MFENIQNLVTKYSTLINLLILIGNGILGYLFKVWFQKKQSELEKNVNEFNHQLQVKFLKVELKIKQLSSVYPDLFLRFKQAESLISGLCRKKQNNIILEPTDISQSRLLINEAVSFMVKNLLFISKEVEKCSDDLMLLMGKFESIISSDNLIKIKAYMNDLRQLTDKLQAQMQNELGADN